MLATGRSKNDEAVKRRDLRLQLCCERITGQSQEDGFVSRDMERGIELEPAAFSAYESLTGEVVSRSGFLADDVWAIGCSLDGHVGDYEGILEIKCPKSATHVGYLRAGVVPAAYLPQILHNLWVSGAAWCDFLSYDPRLGAGLETFLVRVPRDEVAIAAYRLKALAFLREVDDEVAELTGMRREVAVA